MISGSCATIRKHRHRRYDTLYISHEGRRNEIKFLFKKRNLKIVLIALFVFAGAMSIVLGVDFVINQIRKGVVRGTLELRDHPHIYENHSTQSVWAIVALEEIYPPLVYYITEKDEPITSIEKFGDLGEGDLVTADGVIHWKHSLDGSTKYLFLEVEKIQQGIVWEPDHGHDLSVNKETLRRHDQDWPSDARAQ